MSLSFQAKAWRWFHPDIDRVLGNASSWTVVHSQALAALRALDDNSIDACVTDPPAGISFMNKSWDGDQGGRDAWIAWLAEIATEIVRVLKPGAHALVWALPRTSHWTAMALENAGFEIRDVLEHLFATGFPKSVNLGNGRGSAVKPSHENWLLVRKPVQGTLAANVGRFGTGGLNIDACRVERGANDVTEAGSWPPNTLLSHHPDCERLGTVPVPANPSWDTPNRNTEPSSFTGSEVSKVRHTRDGEPSAERRYADQGVTGFAALPGERREDTEDIEQWECVEGCVVQRLNEQSLWASRFFRQFQPVLPLDDLAPFLYQAKPSTSERDQGLQDLRELTGGQATGRSDGTAGVNNPRAGAGRTGGRHNHHATVKSIDLLRWLTRLITPQGGIVIDPFAGSGGGGVAAWLEGCRWIGIEWNDSDDEPSVSVARARISWHSAQPYTPRASLRGTREPTTSLFVLFT